MTGLKEQLRAARRKLETALIQRAFKSCGGNITYAARSLQVSRRWLQRRMRAYGLRCE